MEKINSHSEDEQCKEFLDKNGRMGLYAAVIAEDLIKQKRNPGSLHNIIGLSPESMRKIIKLSKEHGFGEDQCQAELISSFRFILDAVEVIIRATEVRIEREEGRNTIINVLKKAGVDISIQ